MATVQTRLPAPLTAERRFFLGMAIAMAALTFIGFAPTYYLGSVLGGVTTRGVPAELAFTPAIHVHGAFATAWMVLLVVQTSLVSAGRRDLHRALGVAAVPVGLGIAVTSLWVAFAAARAGGAPPGWTAPQFLLIQFGTLGGFLVLGALGLAWRRWPDFHKRLMILATISMLLPAAGRTTRLLDLPAKGTIAGMLLVDVFLLALVAYDLRSRGRLHPATLWGGGAVLLAQPLRYLLAKTPAWESIGTALIG